MSAYGARTKALIIRMTPEEHAQLVREARAEDVTMQVLAERRLLGKPDAQVRRHSPRFKPLQDEELPMTG